MGRPEPRGRGLASPRAAPGRTSSLTDTVSGAVARRRKIGEVFGFDADFEAQVDRCLEALIAGSVEAVPEMQTNNVVT